MTPDGHEAVFSSGHHPFRYSDEERAGGRMLTGNVLHMHTLMVWPDVMSCDLFACLFVGCCAVPSQANFCCLHVVLRLVLLRHWHSDVLRIDQDPKLSEHELYCELPDQGV